jgi:hypothetical protein
MDGYIASQFEVARNERGMSVAALLPNQTALNLIWLWERGWLRTTRGDTGSLLLSAYLLHQFGGEEAAQAHVEDDAKADELVRPHLALPVKDVPEPLAVDGGSSPELGDAHAPLEAGLLDSYGYQLCVVQTILRLRFI